MIGAQSEKETAMSCDVCGAADATVTYAEVVDGVLKTVRLCESCARERGIAESLISIAAPLACVVSELLKGEGGGDESESADAGPTCSQCGMTYAEFRRDGRLGCDACYETFAEQLKPLIRRIHGTTEHLGCVPGALSSTHALVRKLRDLTKELDAAVREENYEKAAKLRDRIAALSREIEDQRRSGGDEQDERRSGTE
jgi:protein arginine kinase activator